MNEYKNSYLILFNAITDALCLLKKEEHADAERLLIKAQIDAEKAEILAEREQNAQMLKELQALKAQLEKQNGDNQSFEEKTSND